MPKKEQPLIKVVIFLEGGLVQETFCDVPLEVTVLDLDEQSEDRWVRTDRTSSPMSEMPPEVAKQSRRRKRRQ